MCFIPRTRARPDGGASPSNPSGVTPPRPPWTALVAIILAVAVSWAHVPQVGAEPTPRAPERRPAAPDRVAPFTGGIAARVRTDDARSVPGDLFLLMAVVGATDPARVYDGVAYDHGHEHPHPEAIESNRAAAELVGQLTGAEVRPTSLTSAPGGGPSAGLIYAIAYLNMVSSGSFTSDITVAATGTLADDGYVRPINSIDQKTAAARFADADVLFTPSLPTTGIADAHAARVVAQRFRARNTGAALADERKWERYRRWGADRPRDGMDVVGVRHLGDVATYLCGAGSEFACSIAGVIGDAGSDPSPRTDEHVPAPPPAQPANTR